jgi:hypothetical protein
LRDAKRKVTCQACFVLGEAELNGPVSSLHHDLRVEVVPLLHQRSVQLGVRALEGGRVLRKADEDRRDGAVDDGERRDSNSDADHEAEDRQERGAVLERNRVGCLGDQRSNPSADESYRQTTR